MDKESIKPIIESVIFASENALTFDRIVSILEAEERGVVREALKELIDEYKSRGGGIYIEEVAGGYQFRTNPEHAPWLRRLLKVGGKRISKAAMEALAIVAYKQPLTRGEVEAIRGVDSGGVLATLMDKRFVKIVGRKEVPGRPVVYGTTKEFLETFDLKDLACLPSLKDIQMMEEEDEGAGHEAEEESGPADKGFAEGAVAEGSEGSGRSEGNGEGGKGAEETLSLERAEEGRGFDKGFGAEGEEGVTGAEEDHDEPTKAPRAEDPEEGEAV